MTDLTPILNQLLKGHDARPTANPTLTLQNIDEFLKEAYQINAHIASLNSYLKGIRQSYLSTAPPPRRNNPRDKQKHLTDFDKEQVDAHTKGLLRNLNASIRRLADTEQVRQNTETIVTRKKYARLGLGALGSWAAGGAGQTKSYEHEQEEAKQNAVNQHRESVLWYLRQKLQECGSLQASMMEKRILREVEKSKSVLAKSRPRGMSDFGGLDHGQSSSAGYSAQNPTQMESHGLYAEEELTEEQVQMFEKQNTDLLKLYESKMDQVKTAEKSLIEISELQTQLVNNLAIQSAHIDQLATDSINTAENIGGGNKQLKQATQRKSTARMVFFASCGLSLFLVVWDLVF